MNRKVQLSVEYRLSGATGKKLPTRTLVTLQFLSLASKAGRGMHADCCLKSLRCQGVLKEDQDVIEALFVEAIKIDGDGPLDAGRL